MESLSVKNNARLKRYALQIASQLPDNKMEAMRVLEYLRDLVEWEDEEPEQRVVDLVR